MAHRQPVGAALGILGRVARQVHVEPAVRGVVEALGRAADRMPAGVRLEEPPRLDVVGGDRPEALRRRKGLGREADHVVVPPVERATVAVRGGARRHDLVGHARAQPGEGGARPQQVVVAEGAEGRRRAAPGVAARAQLGAVVADRLLRVAGRAAEPLDERLRQLRRVERDVRPEAGAVEEREQRLFSGRRRELAQAVVDHAEGVERAAHLVRRADRRRDARLRLRIREGGGLRIPRIDVERQELERRLVARVEVRRVLRGRPDPEQHPRDRRRDADLVFHQPGRPLALPVLRRHQVPAADAADGARGEHGDVVREGVLELHAVPVPVHRRDPEHEGLRREVEPGRRGEHVGIGRREPGGLVRREAAPHQMPDQTPLRRYVARDAVRLAVLRDRELEQGRAVDVAERADRVAPVAQRARCRVFGVGSARRLGGARAGEQAHERGSGEGAGGQGRELYRKAREGRT